MALDTVSSFNDDIMHLSRGLFHYPINTWERGFAKPPATHFYRPYYLHLYKVNYIVDLKKLRN